MTIPGTLGECVHKKQVYRMKGITVHIEESDIHSERINDERTHNVTKNAGFVVTLYTDICV